MTETTETVCEFALFNENNSVQYHNNQYALGDLVFYQRIPPNSATDEIPDHALVLKRNLLRDTYEVYRRYRVALFGSLKLELVSYERSFHRALDFGNGEVRKFGGSTFVACEHRNLNAARDCPINQGIGLN